MEEKFIVRFIVFSGGERYPILLNSNGQPHWYPTLYTTTQVRNASKAPNTIAAVLAAIRVLLGWSHIFNHDLEYRFSHRKFLNEQELESLRHHIQAKADDFNELKRGKGGNVCRIENARGVLEKIEGRISSSTQYIRMTYIADYLEWLAIRVLERSAGQLDTSTSEQIQRMVRGLRKHRPQKTMRSLESARKGLTEEQQTALLTITKPGSKKNPFIAELQIRNQLIVWLLYCLGLRAGELLALRVSDFDFGNNTVLVARRHDNPNDPRTHQPVVKTIDRRIP
jgi:integrase